MYDLSMLPDVPCAVGQRMVGHVQLPVSGWVLVANATSLADDVIRPIPHKPEVVFLADLLGAVHREPIASLDLAIF